MNLPIHGHNLAHHAPKRRQRGQNIIGVLFGLAIIVVFIGFIVAHFLQAKNSSSSTSASTDMVAIIGKTQQTYSGVPAGYAGATPATLINDGDVPAADIQGGNTIVLSGFGTTPVTVAPVGIYGGSNNGLAFTASIPQEQCAEFSRAVSASVVTLTVGGTVVKDSTAGKAFDPTKLATGCGAAGTGGEVTAVATISQ